jgi:hypothetical protein
MSDTHKKMAAALAAVCAYLQEEAGQGQVTPLATADSAAPGVVLPNLWGQYGRQEMMNMRRLVQLRAFSRLH